MDNVERGRFFAREGSYVFFISIIFICAGAFIAFGGKNPTSSVLTIVGLDFGFLGWICYLIATLLHFSNENINCNYIELFFSGLILILLIIPSFILNNPNLLYKIPRSKPSTPVPLLDSEYFAKPTYPQRDIQTKYTEIKNPTPQPPKYSKLGSYSERYSMYKEKTPLEIRDPSPIDPKPRCNAPDCNELLTMPFFCKYCRKKYCPIHRLPENHECPGIGFSFI